MKINKINSTQNFSATIKNTKALRDFITSLQEGSINGKGKMPIEAITENFDKIHNLFPKTTDEVVFTKHTSIGYGYHKDDNTTNIVEGFVKSDGRKANFAFSYNWREFLWNGNNPFDIKKMHNALNETAINVKRIINKDILNSMINEIIKSK